MRLRVIVLVYVVLFVGELSWQAVTPLIPSYIARYTLTDSEGALLLSAASLGILLASVPAAWITRHVDPRALTLIAITIITVSNLGTAVLPTYPGIVASRLLYGMGFDDEREEDTVVDCDGVSVLIAPPSLPLLDGATLDFVEVNAGEYQFIFVNPNEACDGNGGCGGCGSC